MGNANFRTAFGTLQTIAHYVRLCGNTSAPKEVAAVINTDITGLSADGASGSVVLTADSTGPSPYSTIEVTGGTGNVEIGFSTTPVAGTGVAYSIITGEG